MNRTKLALALFFAALFVVAACNSNTATNTNLGASGNRTVNAPNVNAANTNGAPNAADAELAAARSTYNNTCSKCHQANGEGGVVDIDGDKLRVPGFTHGHALKHTDEEYVKQITNGGEGMPKFKGRLTPEQINGLVRFIRTEFQSGHMAGGAMNMGGNANK